MREWRGRTAISSDGSKLGTIQEIYLDAETDRPQWVSHEEVRVEREPIDTDGSHG